MHDVASPSAGRQPVRTAEPGWQRPGVPLRAPAARTQAVGQLGAVTQRTVEGIGFPGGPARSGQHPRPDLEGGAMIEVLAVAAVELCHPIALCVPMEADDGSVQGSVPVLLAPDHAGRREGGGPGPELPQGEDALGMTLLFEELLAGLEQVELGHEAVEVGGVGSVHDG